MEEELYGTVKGLSKLPCNLATRNRAQSCLVPGLKTCSQHLKVFALRVNGCSMRDTLGLWFRYAFKHGMTMTYLSPKEFPDVAHSTSQASRLTAKCCITFMMPRAVARVLKRILPGLSETDVRYKMNESNPEVYFTSTYICLSVYQFLSTLRG